jgi:hypothetical protein
MYFWKPLEVSENPHEQRMQLYGGLGAILNSISSLIKLKHLDRAQEATDMALMALERLVELENRAAG